ncbi:MAG: TetR/AcrR family transcriptional regulator [Myxococcota bacterium]
MDVRRLILDHAVEAVAEHGVRGVSFRDVARRAGVSHQAPYHHFGSLRGIMEEVAREGFSSLSASMRKAASNKEDPLDALHAIGLAYVRFAIKNVGHFRVMFQQALVDIHDLEIESAIETYTVLEEVAERVSDANGPSFLDAETLAHLCWSTVHGLATLLVEQCLQKKSQREMNAEIRSVLEGLTQLLKHSADRR